MAQGAALPYNTEVMESRLEHIILQTVAELRADKAQAGKAHDRPAAAAHGNPSAAARGTGAFPAGGGPAPDAPAGPLAPAAPRVGDKRLAALIRQANRGIADNADHIAKKHLMPFYLRVKRDDPARWESWGIAPDIERRLLCLLQVKPRRTASGVATIAVITKPWPCASDCLYCPNDLRMPKSYVADEPACQRAERNWFDPYLQVASRLRALDEMGHVTDKVELIILGGTWTDYPAAYRRWFVAELFRALNEADDPHRAGESAAERRERYRRLGIPNDEEGCARRVACAQQRVNREDIPYNQAFPELYGEGTPWQDAAAWQTAAWGEVERQHAANEHGAHRVVGLVMETRPDAVDPRAFAEMRRLGATKVQMGIQSLDARILRANRRRIEVSAIRRAFKLARLFGFKTHAHFMVNLLGAAPDGDKADYLRLMDDPALAPDEVKLYPCALVDGTGLVARFHDGSWRPYTEDELTDVLASDLLATPAYCRVSRMIRDIPANDILVGNKKINLRQMVEREADRRAVAAGTPIREIRHREISVAGADMDELRLDEIAYPTTVGDEVFLQWVTPEERIAGFLRLSLPHAEAINALVESGAGKDVSPFPIRPGEAMIREVHVYGRVAGLHRKSGGAQHRGLGRALVERACAIAHERGYRAVNVISAVGTRGYYRNLGFKDNGLYQQRQLG